MFGYASKLPIPRFNADFTAILILISYKFELHTKRMAVFTPPLNQTHYKSNQMQQRIV